MKEKRDWIVITGGGVFRGAFGMGFFEVLEAAGVQERFAEIHGYSVGAHNAGCFISGRMFTGKDVYLKDIPTGQAVFRKKLPKLFQVLFTNLFKPANRQKPLPAVIDVDFLIDKEKQYVPSDSVTKTGIKLFVYFFNSKKDAIEVARADNKEDVYEYLRASSACVPFYPHSVEIDGQYLVDPYTTSDVLNKKWYKIILNNPGKKYLILRHEPKSGWLETVWQAVVLSLPFSVHLRKNFIGRKIKASLGDRKYWSIIEKMDNVVIVKPQSAISPLSDKQEDMDSFYNDGYRAGEKFIEDYL